MNGNFSCPCALGSAITLTTAFKGVAASKTRYVAPGRKVILTVTVTSTAPALPDGTPSLILTLPADNVVAYKTAAAFPVLKPKAKPTQAGHTITWTPAPVPVGQKTAKRNIRSYRYTLTVSKSAATGTYVFPVAFRLLDANGLILEQIFAEATVSKLEG